jgi:hypothetical protein
MLVAQAPQAIAAGHERGGFGRPGYPEEFATRSTLSASLDIFTYRLALSPFLLPFAFGISITLNTGQN